MKFKAAKPDPAANEVAAPPGGWDAKTGSSSLGQSPPPADAGSPASASLTRMSAAAALDLAPLPASRHDDLCVAASLNWILRSPARNPRLRLRLLGLTDLHANLYPYDYYRDCPDDSVGLARAASLVAEARREAPNCLLFDDGDILQGTPLGDLAAEAIIADPGPSTPSSPR